MQNDDYCKNNADTLLKMHLISLIFWWIFVVGGLIIGIFVVIVHACDEGRLALKYSLIFSCTFWDTCRCCFLCMTCGLCDIGKDEKKK